MLEVAGRGGKKRDLECIWHWLPWTPTQTKLLLHGWQRALMALLHSQHIQCERITLPVCWRVGAGGGGAGGGGYAEIHKPEESTLASFKSAPIFEVQWTQRPGWRTEPRVPWKCKDLPSPWRWGSCDRILNRGLTEVLPIRHHNPSEWVVSSAKTGCVRAGKVILNIKQQDCRLGRIQFPAWNQRWLNTRGVLKTEVNNCSGMTRNAGPNDSLKSWGLKKKVF